MTRDETTTLLETVANALRIEGFSVVVEPHDSYQWPDAHYAFVYAGEILGEIGVVTAVGDKTGLDLFWECRHYCCPAPQKGEYRGLYQYENGTGNNVNKFIELLSSKCISGERRKLKDLKKKEICEEKELL